MASLAILKLSPSIFLDSAFTPPCFLAPALQTLHLTRPKQRSRTHCHPFSTTPTPTARVVSREKNRSRGVSAIRRTGPRVPLSVSRYPLPRPVLSTYRRQEFKCREDHGLWGFFNKDRTAMTTPEEISAHGRSWTYTELANKGWHDLWKIWWMCARERNWLSTEANERSRVGAGYGAHEGDVRVDRVDETIENIKALLNDRWNAFEQARKIADDPEFWKQEFKPGDDEENFEPEYDETLDRLEKGLPMPEQAQPPPPPALDVQQQTSAPSPPPRRDARPQ